MLEPLVQPSSRGSYLMHSFSVEVGLLMRRYLFLCMCTRDAFLEVFLTKKAEVSLFRPPILLWFVEAQPREYNHIVAFSVRICLELHFFGSDPVALGSTSEISLCSKLVFTRVKPENHDF